MQTAHDNSTYKNSYFKAIGKNSVKSWWNPGKILVKTANYLNRAEQVTWGHILTSKINRLQPLVNMFAEFDEDVHNSLVAIAFTKIRHDARTDWCMYGTTAALLFPLRNARG